MARGFVKGDVERGGFTVTTDGRTSTTLVQRSFPLATVTVFNAGTAVISSIFSDQGGTPKANPFIADTDGHWNFWANSGSYDIQFSGVSVGIASPFTRFAFFVPDPAITAPIQDPGSNGILARTGLQIVAARTLIGTANRIVITNGDGVAGNPTFDIGTDVVTGPASAADNAIARFDGTTGKLLQNSAVIVADTTGNFSVPDGWTATSASVTSINFATPAGSAGILNFTTPATATDGFGFNFVSGSQTQSLSVVRNVRIAATFNQSGTAGSDTLALGRIETALGSGQHNFIQGFGGAAGATPRFRIDNLGNYFFGATGGFIGDENGNEYLKFATDPSAVNELSIQNGATGNAPAISSTGGDANVSFNVATKGTGNFGVFTNSIPRMIIAGATADAYFGDGITSSSPDNYTINGTGGSGTNIAGANLELAGGKGTGNALPGLLGVRYPLTTTSGTTLQSLSTNAFPPVVNSHVHINNDITVSNTTAEVSILPASEVGSTKIIEAGMARIGRYYRIRISGAVTTTGTPTLRIKAKLGSTIIADTTATTMANNTGSGTGGFTIDVIVGIRTIGAGGNIIALLAADYLTVLGGAMNRLVGGQGTAIDFTASQTFDVTVQWGTASVSNTVNVFTSTIEMSR